MESASKPPVPLPGTPLFPLSADRINNAGRANAINDGEEENISPSRGGFQQPGDGSPLSKGRALGQHSRSNTDLTSPAKWRANADFGGQSPTRLDTARQQLSRSGHQRTNSDVHCLVAQFNSLDIKDHERELKKAEASLKRAQMGREEAEEQLKTFREDTRRLKRDNDEGADRERKMMKRLDAVMEDFHRAKETHAHAQSLYEKEIRRARKEAFKSSSALVKLQEELKATRNALRVSRADLDMERQKLARKDQDLFTAQYELVGEQERVKVVEQEKDALKKSLQEEEVAKCAASGNIALPKADQDDEFASPKKTGRVPVSPTKQLATPSRAIEFTTPNTVTTSKDRVEIEQLHKELGLEKRLRELAEDRVDFMKMECQFGCCSCRVAERKGLAFVHDGSLGSAVAEIQFLRPMMSDAMPDEEQPPAYDEMDVDRTVATRDTKGGMERSHAAASSSSTAVTSRQSQQTEEQSASRSNHTSNDQTATDPIFEDTPMETPQKHQQPAEDDPAASHEPDTPASTATTATFTGAESDSPPADSTPRPQDQHSAPDQDTDMPLPGDNDTEPGDFDDDDEDEAEPEAEDENEDHDHPYPSTPNIRKTTKTTTIPLAHTPSADSTHSTSTTRGAATPSSRRTPTAEPTEPPSRSTTPADYPTQLTPSKSLSRAEAIEKLRAMRRDRAASKTESVGGSASAAPGGLARSSSARAANGGQASVGTPKRAVSHGRALAERSNGRTPGAEGRRDISAPGSGRRK